MQRVSQPYRKRTFKPYTPTYGKRNKKVEETVQLKVARYIRKYYPGVEFHSDYAAGLHLSINQAKIRKALNSGRGWSDMFIAAPRRGYHGLFLELKKEGTTIYVSTGPRKGELVADEQIEIEAKFLTKMNKEGYLALFAVGYEDAIKKVDHYFGRLNAELF